MVGAGQTATTGVLPSYRSDAQESQIILYNPQYQDAEIKTSSRSNHPMANFAHIQIILARPAEFGECSQLRQF